MALRYPDLNILKILILNQFKKLKIKDFEEKLNDIKDMVSQSLLTKLAEIGFNLNVNENQ